MSLERDAKTSWRGRLLASVRSSIVRNARATETMRSSSTTLHGGALSILTRQEIR
jgi:hypothetical protein